MSDNKLTEKIFELGDDQFKAFLEGVKVLWAKNIFGVIVMGLMVLSLITEGGFGIGCDLTVFFLIGWKAGLKIQKEKRKIYQKLDKAGFKVDQKKKIKILNWVEDDFSRVKLYLESDGYPVTDFQKEMAKLENSFGLLVDEVKMGSNPQLVEIYFSKYRLPEKVDYDRFTKLLKNDGQFAIGQSSRGDLMENIITLPHLLIAGTTGRGKSVFFKQVLLSLLKSTQHLQLYLIDLKRGIEMTDFESLPNVRVAKDEPQALHVLQAIHTEMMRRFVYLEANKKKGIIPKVDKMDRIVVGVDEASVLYTIKKSRGKGDISAQTARDITDEIAKLGRAAGIHLILATQKVSKETIDTKIQENIGGRVCFRVNTLPNSLIVLGNKMAYEIPNLPGRAIYSRGNEFLEIQTPLITEETMTEEVKGIKESFDGGERKLFGAMIDMNGLAELKGTISDAVL